MRNWLSLVLVVGLCLPGCNLLDRVKPEAKPPKMRTAAAPAVKPEHVTPENALRKARELNDELDRELEADGAP